MKTVKILSACCTAVLMLAALTSCVHQEGVKKGNNNRPAYLHDSERWGRVVIDTLSNVRDVQAIVNADVNADVFYEQSEEVLVVIEANEKVRKNHEVFVEGNTLTVAPPDERDATQQRCPSIVVRVYSPSIHSVTASGTGDVKARKAVSLRHGLKIESTGTGDVEFEDLTCQGALEALTSGTGDVELETVAATSASLISAGTGDIEVQKLTCTGDVVTESSGTGDVSMRVTCANLRATDSGTGDMDLHVDCKRLEAFATGTGDLELSGQTKRLIKEENGWSSIRSKALKVETVEY